MQKLKSIYHHPVTCPLCKKTFKSQHAWSQHIQKNKMSCYAQQHKKRMTRKNHHFVLPPPPPSSFLGGGTHFSSNPATNNETTITAGHQQHNDTPGNTDTSGIDSNNAMQHISERVISCLHSV